MWFCVRLSSIPRTVCVRPWFALGAVLGLLLAGCQNRDEIKRYTVKKLPHSERKVVEKPQREPMPTGHGQAASERMLAAIAPRGRTFWLFKLTGSKDAAAGQMEKFLGLIQSLKFSDGEDASPEWTLPEGWTERKEADPSAERFATLIANVDGEELPVSVVRFRFPSEGSTDRVPLIIVNVWCEQFGLPVKTESDLSAEEQPKGAEVQQLEVAGTQVTLVNFLAQEAPAAPGTPKWTVPEGWKATAGTRFSTAAFSVTDGTKSVNATVSKAGGDLLGNLNRWRDQVKLQPWSQAEASKSVKTLTVDGSEGTFVDFVGNDKNTDKPMCLLGVIVNHGDSTWFFKLTGDIELAQREKTNFEAFVQSVKFE